MQNNTRVLLIDDEVDYTEPIRFWLQSKGYLVTDAPSGQEGIEIIKQGLADIVFLDLKMPVMDGIETLKRIRKINKDLPVIIVTVEWANEAKFAQARKLGSSGFFPKKGSFEDMENIIETTLRIHKRLPKS